VARDSADRSTAESALLVDRAVHTEQASHTRRSDRIGRAGGGVPMVSSSRSDHELGRINRAERGSFFRDRDHEPRRRSRYGTAHRCASIRRPAAVIIEPVTASCSVNGNASGRRSSGPPSRSPRGRCWDMTVTTPRSPREPPPLTRLHQTGHLGTLPPRCRSHQTPTRLVARDRRCRVITPALRPRRLTRRADVGGGPVGERYDRNHRVDPRCGGEHGRVADPHAWGVVDLAATVSDR
jgi:hypothetical protein